MKEYFDIRDSAGNPTGEVKARSLVHRDGDIHGTSHVWLVRKNKKSGYDVLLQKRSDNKDSFPGCYDISSAGHLPAGARLQGIGSPGIRRGTWNRRKSRRLTVSWHARRGCKRGILWKTLS